VSSPNKGSWLCAESTYVDQLLSHILVVVEGVKQLRAGMALPAQPVRGLALLTRIHLSKL
jgi:hypothetical protein